VESVPESSVPAGHAKMSQKGARFAPALLPVVAGSTVDMTNDDWVAHSVFSRSEVKPFDLGLSRRESPGPSQEVTAREVTVAGSNVEVWSPTVTEDRIIQPGFREASVLT